MPSTQHEMPLEFLRNRPELAARLLETFGFDVPDHDRAELSATECPDIQPKDYRADAVVTFSRAGAVRMAAVVEVQRRDDERKRYSWPVYVATVRARLECPTALLVICGDDATASWAAEPIPLGNPDSCLVPLVLGPEQVPVVTSPEEAREMPEIALLSAVAHGGENIKTLLACFEALEVLPQETFGLYYDFVVTALPPAALSTWEELMADAAEKYRSEFARRYVSEGEARGEARGEAKAILTVLAERGIDVSDEQRNHILTCTCENTLTTWLTRALTATSTSQLFR
ncbi:hypothetical protein [Streptomonospora salina]|uniref:Transposase (putative) YhgA-like domain-containing protein n=1 Tax=Streptomonospora salina TaxID=104205 RepID=A0A841E0C1_9ACTN|nr:hypothetical protein [Streptomonospora salina]MBB5997187.1 hypothetical protein [Streptomonospora salina]